MLFLDIIYHTFFIFLVQSLLYLLVFIKIETNAITNLISKSLKCYLYNIDNNYYQKLKILLDFIPLPKTSVENDNNNWKKMVILIIIIYGIFVILSSIIITIYFPKVSVFEMLLKNIIIFMIIAIIEYMFFMNVIRYYTEVNIDDIKEAAFETIKTGKVIYEF